MPSFSLTSVTCSVNSSSANQPLKAYHLSLNVGVTKVYVLKNSVATSFSLTCALGLFNTYFTLNVITSYFAYNFSISVLVLSNWVTLSPEKSSFSNQPTNTYPCFVGIGNVITSSYDLSFGNPSQVPSFNSNEIPYVSATNFAYKCVISILVSFNSVIASPVKLGLSYHPSNVYPFLDTLDNSITSSIVLVFGNGLPATFPPYNS